MADDENIITLNEVLEKKKEDNFHEFESLMFSKTFDYDSVDNQGKTLIMLFIESQSNSEFVWFCLEYFADPNIKDNLGNTALHYAFSSPNKAYIYPLLLFNADYTIKNNEGKEPYEMVLNNNSLSKSDVDNIYSLINSLKFDFAKIGRSRREMSKSILDFMESLEGIKGITIQILTAFNIWLNNDSRSIANSDAELFFKSSKLPTSTDRYYYEEWIIAILRIASIHGLDILDKFFMLYNRKFKTGTKPDLNYY